MFLFTSDIERKKKKQILTVGSYGVDKGLVKSHLGPENDIDQSCNRGIQRKGTLC